MLKIAVCDDNHRDAELLIRQAERILFARTEYAFTCFGDGRELVCAVEQGDFDFDLLFLDIHMKGMDGMTAAAYLREREVDVDVIFFTVSQEHVYEGYTYRAFAYLLKPVQEERLKRELNRYLDEKERCTESLNVTVRGTTHRVPLDKILYFESDVRKIIVHILGREELQFYGKLDELQEMLETKGFFRCHQSYLVNRRFVDTVNRTGVRLKGRAPPVSRRYWDILKQTRGI